MIRLVRIGQAWARILGVPDVTDAMLEPAIKLRR